MTRELCGVGVAWAVAIGASAAAPAQDQAKTEVVTAGPEYKAGGFHRLMLGSSYRDLWTTPVELPVLDLATEGGGLQPVRRVGGQQTKGLALVGKDGLSYTFRGEEKDPTNLLPEELHDTFVEGLLRDQMAAQHPAGALIADELSRAAGVATVPVRLVVMPDDPALGEFRDAFKRLPGTISVYPTAANAAHAGFDGASEIIDHSTLYARLTASPDDRVAVREYLRARLFDVYISDFDRHRKQWRWMRRPGDAAWHPIPEDRDQAFARYEGLLPSLVSSFVPQIRKFGKEYDRILGLTYNGREQDRWLLPQLPRDAWHAEAEALRAALTDEVLERAARRMPPEWYAIDGARMVAALKARRATLVKEADAFYDHLAEEVDVHATDAAELARVERRPDGGIRVQIARLGAGGVAEAPYFERLFVGSETDDLRLYMRGGDDRVEVTGPSGPITLRVVGGKGDDRLVVTGGGGTRFYDAAGNNRVEGDGIAWDRGPYQAPPGPAGAPWIPPRDWGRDYFFIPWASYSSDYGVFLGGGFTTVGYSFRKSPWSDQQTLRAGWAFDAQQPRVDYRGEFRRVNSGTRLGLRVYWSGLEVQRFYGFGNETTSEEDDDFYKVHQRQVVVAPSVTWPLVGALELTLAPALQWANTRERDDFVTEAMPYGSGTFGQVGGLARLSVDTRRALARSDGAKSSLPQLFGAAGYPVSGVYLEAAGAVFPEVWDVTSSYGWVEGQAAGFWTAGRSGRATLAARVGSKHMFGDYPYFNAAVVGGGNLFSGFDEVRGLFPNRYIGDTSLYGNAELRLYISRFFVALPGEWGLFGFGDVGRVWLAGESSDTWHPSWGGGIWIGLLSRANSVAFTYAKSDERTAFFIRAGFSF